MILSCGNSGSRSKSSDGAGTGSKKYRIELHRLHHIQHLTVQEKDLRMLLKRQGLRLILMRKMPMEKQLMQI